MLFDIVISEKGNAGGGARGQASDGEPSDADGMRFLELITDLQAGALSFGMCVGSRYKYAYALTGAPDRIRGQSDVNST